MGTASSINWSAGNSRKRGSAQKGAAGQQATLENSVTARAFDYDLLTMFVRNEAVAALTVPILAIVFAGTMLNWATRVPFCSGLPRYLFPRASFLR